MSNERSLTKEQDLDSWFNDWMKACHTGDVQKIKNWIENEKINKKFLPVVGSEPFPYKNKAMQWAAANGKIDAVEFFLKAPEMKEFGHAWESNGVMHGDWAWRWACMNGHWKVIQCLLKNRVETKLFECHEQDLKILGLALSAKYKHWKAVEGLWKSFKKPLTWDDVMSFKDDFLRGYLKESLIFIESQKEKMEMESLNESKATLDEGGKVKPKAKRL